MAFIELTDQIRGKVYINVAQVSHFRPAGSKPSHGTLVSIGTESFIVTETPQEFINLLNKVRRL